MTDFDVFTTEAKFAPFAQPAAAAERIYAIDSVAGAMNCS